MFFSAWQLGSWKFLPRCKFGDLAAHSPSSLLLSFILPIDALIVRRKLTLDTPPTSPPRWWPLDEGGRGHTSTCPVY